MHAFRLADLAAMVSVHGQQLLAAPADTMDDSLAVYWKASRCRLDRWCRSIHALAAQAGQHAWPPDALCVLEEILVSELLTRVMAAIAAAHDERHARAESGPIARNIFISHLDVRRRVLSLAASTPHGGTQYSAPILALGRQCDRWSDLMLGYLASYAPVDEFAASPARVRDFAYDARGHLRSGNSSDLAVTMLVTGLRSSLATRSHAPTPNGDLNLAIGAAVISCFSPSYFDSFGLLSSTWLERLRTVPDETLARLESICRVPHDSSTHVDGGWPVAPPGPHDVRRPQPRRRTGP